MGGLYLGALRDLFRINFFINFRTRVAFIKWGLVFNWSKDIDLLNDWSLRILEWRLLLMIQSEIILIAHCILMKK